VAREIIVNSESGEIRAAVLEDGVLVDLFIERSLHPRYAGNIYRGTVENVLPGMQAAFVDVGLERNVFLYVDDALAGRNGREGRIVREADGEEITVPNKKPRSIKDILKPGQEIMVQVSKEPIGTKGARVVTDITLPGRYVVLMPTVDYVGVSRRIDEDGERDRLKKIAQAAKPKRMGVIVRTVAEGLSQEEIASDIQFLVRLWRRIQARGRRAKAPALLHKDYDLVFRLVRDHFAEDVTQFVVDEPDDLKKVNDLVKMFPEPMRDKVHLYTGQEPIFDSYGLEEEIARALRRKVWLACGGYLVIDHTEALTVIDVNTGKFTGSTCLADTVLKTNLEAATEIARQMRLRNIGGIIVADFIDMDDEDHQKQVVRKLEESLARDKTKASVLGFTQLGLVEMTRKKVQQGLAESMMKVCPMCDGRGRILSEETLAFRAMRAIKKEALSTSQPAMLVLLHPSVAAVLIGTGGSNLAALEEETGKAIYVKGSFDQKVEDIVVAAVGTREDVEKKALPVAAGDLIDVVIEEPHMTNSRDGIARLEGYVIDVEGAGRMIGTRVKAKVTKVFKTYARARLVSTDDSVAQAEQAQEPGAGDQVPAARAQGSAGKDQTAAAGAASVAGTTGTRVATATPASVAGVVPASATAAVPAPVPAAAATPVSAPATAAVPIPTPATAPAAAASPVPTPTPATAPAAAATRVPAPALAPASGSVANTVQPRAQDQEKNQASRKAQPTRRGRAQAKASSKAKQQANPQDPKKAQPAQAEQQAKLQDPEKAQPVKATRQAKPEQERKAVGQTQGVRQSAEELQPAPDKDANADKPAASSSTRGTKRNGRRSRRGSGRAKAGGQPAEPSPAPAASQAAAQPAEQAVAQPTSAVKQAGTGPSLAVKQAGAEPSPSVKRAGAEPTPAVADAVTAAGPATSAPPAAHGAAATATEAADASPPRRPSSRSSRRGGRQARAARARKAARAAKAAASDAAAAAAAAASAGAGQTDAAGGAQNETGQETMQAT